GGSSNSPCLRNLLAHADFTAGHVHTRGVDENMAALAAERADQRRRFVETAQPAATDGGFAGARVKSRDPLALFAYDSQVKAEQATAGVADEPPALTGPDGSAGVASPIQGTIVTIPVAVADDVRPRHQLAVLHAL